MDFWLGILVARMPIMIDFSLSVVTLSQYMKCTLYITLCGCTYCKQLTESSLHRIFLSMCLSNFHTGVLWPENLFCLPLCQWRIQRGMGDASPTDVGFGTHNAPKLAFWCPKWKKILGGGTARELIPGSRNPGIPGIFPIPKSRDWVQPIPGFSGLNIAV